MKPSFAVLTILISLVCFSLPAEAAKIPAPVPDLVQQPALDQAAPGKNCRHSSLWQASDLNSPVMTLRFFVCLKYNSFLAQSFPVWTRPVSTMNAKATRFTPKTDRRAGS